MRLAATAEKNKLTRRKEAGLTLTLMTTNPQSTEDLAKSALANELFQIELLRRYHFQLQPKERHYAKQTKIPCHPYRHALAAAVYLLSMTRAE